MANPAALHALLLLSDSALPLGSFAFSSGLESYLAHNKHNKHHSPSPSSLSPSSLSTSSSTPTPTPTPLQTFDAFLDMSLRNLASTSLPYVLDAYHDPSHLLDLDNDLDASTPCTVARRASVAQGKALVGLWERALAPEGGEGCLEGVEAMRGIGAALKARGKERGGDGDGEWGLGLRVNAHFAPLFGVVCRALGLAAEETAYLFLLNHTKAVLSAAVRASVMGPYQSHAMLASVKLQERIKAYVNHEKGTRVEDAGLTVPPMDLWLGRHELLYSRIFNS